MVQLHVYNAVFPINSSAVLNSHPCFFIGPQLVFEMKFEFLRIVCDCEHFIPLNFPWTEVKDGESCPVSHDSHMTCHNMGIQAIHVYV